MLRNGVENIFWGILVSTVLFGITIVQGWLYLHNNNDKWPLRVLVVCLILLDLATVISNAELAHHFFISSFGNPNTFLVTPRWANLESFLTDITNAAIQIFFAYRVYLLSKNKFATALIVLTALGSCAAGLAMSADSTANASVTNFSTTRMKIEVGLFTGLSAISDIISTFMLTRFLTGAETGVRRTRAVLHRLVVYVVTRGFLVTAFQIANCIVYLIDPGSLNWMAIQLCLARIYVITMVAMLNARPELQVRIRDDITASGGMVFASNEETEVSGSSGTKISSRLGGRALDLEAGSFEFRELKAPSNKSPDRDVVVTQ